MMMRPSIAQLEAFYWVVRLGSIKEAAHHLNMAQPSISLRISDLEEQLGRPMFDREHRKLTLTRYGEQLLPRVTSIINELSGLRQLAASADQVAGVVRVGLTEVLAQVCLPTCMKRLSRQFPEVQLDITVGISAELEQGVISRQLDMAFVINPRGDPVLGMTQLGIQEAIWVASPQLSLPRFIDPSILAVTTIVTSPHPTPMYQLIIDWFRDGGLEPSKLCRCSSVITATQLVRGGLGAGLLPVKLIESDLKSGNLIQLKPRKQAAPARLYCIFRSADQYRPTDAVRSIFHDVIIDMKFLKTTKRKPLQIGRKAASVRAF
jgi:DNA-binding transcriptional LysR family regulator